MCRGIARGHPEEGSSSRSSISPPGCCCSASPWSGYYGALGLRFGQLTSVGPGLMPRSVAVLVGVFGVGLVVTSFLSVGPRLERWHLRGPFFVLGAVLLFAMTIRGSTLTFGSLKIAIPQLGLAIAGPLTVLSRLAGRPRHQAGRDHRSTRYS